MNRKADCERTPSPLNPLLRADQYLRGSKEIKF